MRWVTKIELIQYRRQCYLKYNWFPWDGIKPYTDNTACAVLYEQGKATHLTALRGNSL
jgi:hypothetical protein